MADAMTIGSQITVTGVYDYDLLGTVIGKNPDNNTYLVSIDPIGKVVILDSNGELVEDI